METGEEFAPTIVDLYNEDQKRADARGDIGPRPRSVIPMLVPVVLAISVTLSVAGMVVLRRVFRRWADDYLERRRDEIAIRELLRNAQIIDNVDPEKVKKPTDIISDLRAMPRPGSNP